MPTDTHDKELRAIATVLSALTDLTPVERDRVLAYVQTRLDLRPSIQGTPSTADLQLEGPVATGRARGLDIRTFAEEKQPRSANEMAALVAYYLQYEAPETERKGTIGKVEIDRYFHLARFRKPKDANFTLVNSKNAGYLDQRERGQYALNPVGYNLISHKLPRRQKS